MPTSRARPARSSHPRRLPQRLLPPPRHPRRPRPPRRRRRRSDVSATRVPRSRHSRRRFSSTAARCSPAPPPSPRSNPSRSNPARARGVRRQRQQDGRRVPSRGPRRPVRVRGEGAEDPRASRGRARAVLHPPGCPSSRRRPCPTPGRATTANRGATRPRPRCSSSNPPRIAPDHHNPHHQAAHRQAGPEDAEDIGTIDGILNAISPAITGSVAAEPEEVVASSTKVKDGRSYYEYELTPFAEFGLHSVSPCPPTKTTTTIATIAASEKQWAKSEADLKKVIDSFRVCVK